MPIFRPTASRKEARMNETTSPKRPKAYSYLRFSTPDQMKGDSERRQLDAARRYAREHELELDEELTFHDLGVSAFRGKNANVGMLARFRRAVEDDIVEPGSFLLVEDFDRLSRMSPWDAFPVFQEIINSGITVVTLKDGEIWRKEALQANPLLLMKSLFAMWNGHNESVKKSARVADAMAAKRRKLVAGEPTARPYKRMGPAWTVYDDASKSFVAIPERVEVVRAIFAKADAGAGIDRIARQLNEAGAPTWGEGKRRAKFWRGSYIRKILINKAVIGTFTPHTIGRDEVTGARRDNPLEPIPNYYPTIVEPEVFERVSGRVGTTAARGRNAGRLPTSLVAGVAKCARCGSSMLLVKKGKPPKNPYGYLVCSKAHAKAHGCEYLAVRYETVVEALRANARTIIEEAPRGADTAELEQEIAGLDHVVGELNQDLEFARDEAIRHKSKAMAAALGPKEAELREAARELQRLRERRDAIASGYVMKRLEALRAALEQEPFDASAANNALRQAAQAIVVDPTGSLTFWWHHSDTVTEGIRFWSRHAHGHEFDAADEEIAAAGPVLESGEH